MVITSDVLILDGRFDLLPKRKWEVCSSKFLQNSSTIEYISVTLSKQIIRRIICYTFKCQIFKYENY